MLSQHAGFGRLRWRVRPADRASAGRLSATSMLLIIVPFLVGLPLRAQVQPAWSPIAAQELALKDNPDSPGAPAMVLDREEYFDDVQNFMTVYFRIKIFTDEGKRFGDVQLPYYSEEGSIDQIRARTVWVDGSSFEFQGEVYDKVVAKSKRLRVQAKAFTLPAVEAGSVIEYSFRRTWRRYLPDVILNAQRYLFTTPISYPTISWVMEHELYTRYARFRVRPIPPPVGLHWSGVNLPEGSQVLSHPDGTFELEVRNIAPLEKEDYMPPESLLSSSVHFYYVLGFVGNPDDYWIDYSKRHSAEVDQFVGHDKGVERVVKETVQAGDSSEEKVRKLYIWAQHIRNLSYESSRTQKEQRQENLKEAKSAGDIVSRGYGTGNEINYLYVALLRAARLDAQIVRLADRSHGVFHRTVPDPGQLNAMVVMVQVDGKPMFLDPADHYCPYGLLPWGETGIQGLRIATAGDAFVQVPGQKSTLAVKRRSADLKLGADGSLSGTVNILFSGQEALTRRLNSYDDDEGGKRKAIEDEIRGWLPSSTSVELGSISNWDDPQQDLRVECRISIADFALRTPRRMLVPASVFQVNRVNPFRHAARKYPINFNYSHQEVDRIRFELPAGYQVEALPSPRHDGNEYYKFETSFSSQAKSLEYQRTFAMDGIFFSLDRYPQIRSAYEKVVASDAEKVVLRAESVEAH